MATEPAKPDEKRPRLSNVGGTPGGAGEFLIGLVCIAIGGYLFLKNTHVTGSYVSFPGLGTFGLTIAPMFSGIAFLFFNAKSPIGWILTAAGAVVLFVRILANMNLYFRSTSLLNTLFMIGLVAGGLGLIARAVRSH